MNASFQEIPYTTFDQLIQNQFEIFTKPFVFHSLYPNKPKDYSELRWQADENCIMAVSKSKFEKIVKATKVIPVRYDPAKEFHKAFKDYGTMNISERVFANCDNRAYVNWKYDVEKLRHEIDPKFQNNIFIGEEVLFYRDQGWRFFSYHHSKFLKQVSSLQASGIPEFLYVWKVKPGKQSRTIFKKLSLQSNLSMLFIILLTCLVIALVCILVEAGSVSIGGFIKTCLRKLRKRITGLSFEFQPNPVTCFHYLQNSVHKCKKNRCE